MDGGTGISGAAVGVLVDVGCATAISGFTVGSNRAVSALMSTVADEASVIPSKPSNASRIVNLAACGMLVVAVARRLGSEGPLLAYCAAPF
jgi:hypothetical protein